MEYNAYTKDTKAEDKAVELYSDVIKLLKENEEINEIAMMLLQSMGYNGFKRWHRYRTRQFHECILRLHNELFDRFHKTVRIEEKPLAYAPASMNAHLMSWKERLADSMEKLGMYAREYINITGMESDIMCHAMHLMARDYEKVCRYYERFAEGDWLAHDMHVVDDMIHYRFKKKEAKHGYKY